jgi:hypothetical protein
LCLSLCGWFWRIWACMLAMLVDMFWRSCIYAARNYCITNPSDSVVEWYWNCHSTSNVDPDLGFTIWVLGSRDLDARTKRWTSRLAKGRIDKAKTIQGCEDWGKNYTPTKQTSY